MTFVNAHLKLYKLIILCFIFPVVAAAQSSNPTKEGYRLSPAFELMRSTHSNLFYAPSLKVNYLFSNGLEPGIGIEYSTSSIHHDNGYVLRKVHLLPVYGNLKYNFNSNKKLSLFTELSIGHSFNRYHRATDSQPHIQKKITEGGIYMYTGLGTKYAITKNANVFFAVGFKGYKFSMNDLDINPHGLSFMLGCSFF